MTDSVEKIIARTFEELAHGLETGSFSSRPKIAITGIGSEHGEEVLLAGAVAASNDADILYIGTLKHPSVKTLHADNEKKAHEVMESLLKNGTADGAVTMHFPFPIGVSTVGKVSTPGLGKNIFIATTTGTSATDRVEGMIKNTLAGIICAKACGIENPSVGILNIDGARQTESALKELSSKGYKINFGSSERADGGCILRGNDVLAGACDILVTDPLTGNVIIKMLSSFTSGGKYETIGFGYGPGIGRGYHELVMIVSRASGSPVIHGAISYAATLIKAEYRLIAEKEFAAAEKAGLSSIIEKFKTKTSDAPSSDTVKPPKKEVVTGQLPGIEITELEDAVRILWKNNIYAESGMGCTGPIILVNETNIIKAKTILSKEGFISN